MYNPCVGGWELGSLNKNMADTNKLKELQENLAKDLVQLETNKSVTEEQLDEITEAYSKVYDIVSNLKSYDSKS